MSNRRATSEARSSLEREPLLAKSRNDTSNTSQTLSDINLPPAQNKRLTGSYSMLGMDAYMDENGVRHLVPLGHASPTAAHTSPVIQAQTPPLRTLGLRSDTLPIHDQRRTSVATQRFVSLLEEKLIKDARPTFRERGALFLAKSRAGRVVELIDAILSLLFCIVYCVSSIYTETVQPLYLSILEIVLALIIFIAWVPRIYFSRDPIIYMRSSFALVSYLALLPVIIAYCLRQELATTYYAGSWLVYLFPFRFSRLHMCINMILVPSQNSLFQMSLIRRKALRLFATIFFILATASVFVHIVEVKMQGLKLTLFDAFWFATVSSTSGLTTNIVPDNVFSRAVILYVMIMGAIFIPATLSELFDMMRRKSLYDHSYRPSPRESHVLVVGRFEHNSLVDFLREFLCIDHGISTIATKVVILHPDEPDELLHALLQDPMYVQRVQYVKGTALSFRHLQKVAAHKSKACFILSAKYAATSHAGIEDSETVLRALALKKYDSDLQLHVQILSPMNKTHLGLVAEQLVCIDEFRYGLLATQCIAPGFATLIHILTNTLTESASRLMQREMQHRPDAKWLSEYAKSVSQEFYQTTLSSHFAGLTFCQASEIVYVVFNAVLFAIGVRASNGYSLLLHPSEYILRGDELAFVIAQDSQVAEQLSTFAEDANIVDIMDHHAMDDLSMLAKESQSTSSSAASSILNCGTSSLPSAASVSVTTALNDTVKSTKRKSVAKPTSAARIVSQRRMAGKRYRKNMDSVDLSQPLLDGTFYRSVFRQNIAPSSTSADTLPAHVSQHILICDHSAVFPSNIDCFIAPLRSPHLSQQWPIVILSLSSPTATDREYLSQFPLVYFIEGNPLEQRALRRAGVERASRILILTNHANYSRIQTRIADSPTLFIILNCEAMARADAFITTELLHTENVKFLSETDASSSASTVRNEAKIGQAVMTPAFYSGHVYLPWMMDTLLCQSYYNPHLLNILRQLLFSGVKEFASHNAGHVNVDAEHDYSQKLGHLFSVAVPSEMIGETYRRLFRYMLRYKQTLCLGLYRSANKVNYVLANPDPDIILNELDFVYILSHRQP